MSDGVNMEQVPILCENTVRVDFSRLSRDLTPREAHDFVEMVLRVNREDLLRLQWNYMQRCLFLKMRDQATAERLIGEHSGRHYYPFGAVRLRVTLSMENGTSQVILHDLSEMVDNDTLFNYMSYYGWVIDVSDQLWSGNFRYSNIDSGQRAVRMIIHTSIPSIITIAGERTRVSYDGRQIDRPNILGRAVLALGRGIQRIFEHCSSRD